MHPGTKLLNEILDNCKSRGNKRGLGYINKIETPISGDTIFVKGKEGTPSQAVPSSIPSHCTHCKKFRHAHNGCHTRFLGRYESQVNGIVNDFNSLKNNILNIRKERKLIKNLRLSKAPLSRHLK